MKYLNKHLNVEGLSLNDINTLYHEFFHRKDYEWWRDVEPLDVVVDIGACVGFFTCHALDRGAHRIYAIEPSRAHLQTLLKNTSAYFIDNGELPVVPIHAAIGSDREHYQNVFTNNTDTSFRVMNFAECMTEYDISWIDYLKIDCEGGEYDIFKESNMEYLTNSVGHIAVEFHVTNPWQVKQWVRVRDTLLQQFDTDQIRFLEHEDRENAFNDFFLYNGNKTDWCSFMLYISN
jgi:FkbM family methyltransferase